MNFNTLISVEGLAQFLDDPNWAVVDCRFWLDDTERGFRDYKVSHIPGAIYAHLDQHLSGPVVVGQTGRHPLPSVEEMASRLGNWGIGENTQVIAYDDRGGMIAARLWWLLRWLGHESVAVLDGGFPAWVADDHPVTDEVVEPIVRTFSPNVQAQMVVISDDVLTHFGDPGSLLIDSRAPERYRGESEPIDPIPGRIPGAINYFWNKNLWKENFELKDILRGRFNILFGDIPAQNVTFYCGSGVSAAHNILSVAHAGLGMPKLYAGSWSHWIVDPERPIMLGE